MQQAQAQLTQALRDFSVGFLSMLVCAPPLSIYLSPLLADVPGPCLPFLNLVDLSEQDKQSLAA